MKNYIRLLKDLAAKASIDFVSGTSGDDDLGLHPTANPSILVGWAGSDTLTGRNGTDILIGGRGDDTIDGGNGRDYLRGDLGDDVMSGGNGADVFTSFQGSDTLTGGRGPDTFIFRTKEKGDVDQFATITDFDHNDRILVRGAGDVEVRDHGDGLMLSVDGNDLALVAGRFAHHRDAVEDLLDQTDVGRFSINDMAFDTLSADVGDIA